MFSCPAVTQETQTIDTGDDADEDWKLLLATIDTDDDDDPLQDPTIDTGDDEEEDWKLLLATPAATTDLDPSSSCVDRPG